MAETVRWLKVNRRYESAGCAWCGDALLLGEDGAVCEACESPHHARCWNKENGCNGDALCVNRPLQQIPDVQHPPESRSRQLRPGESLCPSCGDITDGFCIRCHQTSASYFEYTGPRETVQEAKDALKCAIVGLLCLGFIFGPLAIVKGTQAKKLIKMNPRLGGEGIATTAQVLGAIEVVLFICYVFGNLPRR